MTFEAQISDFLSGMAAWAALALPNFVAAVLLILVGLWFAAFAARTAGRLVDRSRIDPTLRSVITTVVHYAVVIVVLVAALGQVGFQTTSLIAALGAAGLAIGLALQGTLSNIAAGFMLLWLKPFRLGDYIETGSVAGTVKDIGLFATELHTWDGIFRFVPNSQLWNTPITNYSRLDKRLVEVEVGISYDDDIATARRVLSELVETDPRVLREPSAPTIFVKSLGDSAVVMAVRTWVRSSDYWATRCDLTERAKLDLETAGLSIPYPQIDVHHPNSGAKTPQPRVIPTASA